YASSMQCLCRHLVCCVIEYNTRLYICCSLSMRHPDTLFEQYTIDAAQAIREDGEPLIKVKCLKVHKAGGIERSFLIFIGAEIIGTLIKCDLFVNFGQ